MTSKKSFIFSLAALAMFVLTPVTNATHSWADYHWARNSTSFNLVVINSTTSEWDSYVTRAIEDWSASSKVNMIEDPNGSTAKKYVSNVKVVLAH